jgi:hypothetical protein
MVRLSPPLPRLIGSGGIWERLHYDWSDRNHVKLTTTDSNMFGGASGYTYTLTRQADGKTDVDVVIVREGKNLKGKVLAGVLGTVGSARWERHSPPVLKPSKPAAAQAWRKFSRRANGVHPLPVGGAGQPPDSASRLSLLRVSAAMRPTWPTATRSAI